MRIEIRNAGYDDVRLTRLTVPYGGPASRTPIRLVSGEPELEAERDIDAVVALDETLAAGQIKEIALPFEFRDDGCHGPNTAEYLVPLAPFVHVQTLGRTGARELTTPPYGAAPDRSGSCA